MVFDRWEAIIFLETYRDHDIYWIGSMAFHGIVGPDGTEWTSYPQELSYARTMIDRTYPDVEETFVPFLDPDRYWTFSHIYSGFRILKYMPGATHYAVYLGDTWYICNNDHLRVSNDIIQYINQTTIPIDAYQMYRDILVSRQTYGRWYVFELPGRFYTYETYADCTAEIDKYLGAEPEQYWEYHSTYRGIEIQVYMPGATDYGAYAPDWVSSTLLSAVQSSIDEYLGPEEPETWWEHDSYYRGIEIQRWMPGTLAYGAWIDGDWIVRVSLSELQGLIDTFLGPEEEPPVDGDGVVVPGIGGIGLLILLWVILKR